MSLTRGHSPAAPAPPIRPQPPEGARRIWSRDVTRFGSPLVTHRYIYFAGTLRDPGTDISALDCYQSVDYVREFGFGTMDKALGLLSDKTRGQIALGDLIDTASDFAIGAITPMLEGVRALDFGTWGRSLKIGEEYARTILKTQNPDEARAKRIASSLVYGYTHHPFPIDIDEALRLKLPAMLMKEEIYQGAREIVESCHERIFVDFISEKEAADEASAPAEEEASDTQGEGTGGPSPRTQD